MQRTTVLGLRTKSLPKISPFLNIRNFVLATSISTTAGRAWQKKRNSWTEKKIGVVHLLFQIPQNPYCRRV